MTNQAKRELTLEEWVGGLPEGHRARVELAEIERENEALREGIRNAMNELDALGMWDILDAPLEEQDDDLEDG